MKKQIDEPVPLPLQIEAFLNEEGYTTADETWIPCSVLPYATKIGIVWQEKVQKTTVFVIRIPVLNKKIRIPRTSIIDGKRYLIGMLSIENPKVWTIEGYGQDFFNVMVQELIMFMTVKFGVSVSVELKDDEPEVVEQVAMFIG